MKETNLVNIKVTARMLLYIEPTPCSDIGPIVSHPYFQTYIYPAKKNGTHSILDIRQKEDLVKARNIIAEKIEAADNIFKILKLIRTPYYPAFFKYTYKDMSLEDMSKVLHLVWIQTEFPNYDPNLKKEEFIKLFTAANKEILMNKDDYIFFSRLPEKLTVYRGTKYESWNALSWTLNKQQAIWFSERFLQSGEKGQVYQAEIKKKYVFAYFNERNEKEIVLDYRKLENIKEI